MSIILVAPVESLLEETKLSSNTFVCILLPVNRSIPSQILTQSAAMIKA